MSPKIVHELESKFGSIYGPEEEEAMLEVFRRNAPASGDASMYFERDFARYCGTQHARAVSNGTAALFLSLIALDIKPGDRIVTTPLTWIATAAAGETLGAKVDFVDIDPRTYNLDVQQLEATLGPDVKVVIPVHLYGQCCDMDELLALSEQHGFAVLEDACHAPGASYKGRKAGSMGALGCFSFHEQKNMSTLGEGGMMVTDDPALFERASLYRSHCTRVYGKSTKYCSLDEFERPMGKRYWYQDFEDCGYNMRMTDVQAAVGIEQLVKLDQMNGRRRVLADYLNKHLQEVPGLTLPCEAPDRTHVFHLYPVQIDPEAYGLSKEDFIYRMLHEKGIKIGTHYTPLHLSTAFQRRGFRRGQFPVVEAVSERLVTLPIHPRLTHEAMDYLIDSIRALSRTS